MITRKELLNSKEYWLVRFQNALYEEVEKYLAHHNMSKTEFASRLGVSKGYISQILNGDFDHKLSKFIEISLAIDKAPLITFKGLEKHINSKEKIKRPQKKEPAKADRTKISRRLSKNVLPIHY